MSGGGKSPPLVAAALTMVVPTETVERTEDDNPDTPIKPAA